jgi:hypothetical protein
MFQPTTEPKQYDHLFTYIDTGLIKIPKFQRDFVWTTTQTAKLLDSIIKGFPIGSFIFWKTRDEMRHVKDIGNVKLPDPPKGDAVMYVLDGQQRITSLYAVRKGVRFTKEGQEMDCRRISINLALDPEGDEQVVSIDPPEKAPYITVHALLNGTVTDFSRDYPAFLEKIDFYRIRLTGYNFPTIVISECPIDVACEVFTRINTGGTVLTLFEIMVAKTYDETLKFDLAKEYDDLLDNNGRGKDLEDAGYETVPESTVLQCIAAHLCGQVRSKDILQLNKKKFIEAWPVVKNGIFAAVDYLRTHLRIPVSRLLPYDALLVPFTYFLLRNGGKAPTPVQNKLLTQYFWWASLSSRFTSGSEGKLAQDLKRMDRFLAGERPDYSGEEVRLTLEELRSKWFSAGDAFCKAIICLYAYKEPKSFASNSIVKLDNSWLKVASSRNYHHFFPKSYLTKSGFTEEQANSVLNITLVDDYLNKRMVGARPPSVYMKAFKDKNDELDQTMRSHYIDDMDKFGIWSDDYRAFIEHRGKRVLTEIEKRLEPDLG